MKKKKKLIKPLELSLDFEGKKSKPVVVDVDSYKFTESQRKAFETFLQGKNMFITGEGGTGKSYLTKSIIDYCQKTKKSTIVCAPTGIAAQNIGGATLHSVFGISTEIQKPERYCKKPEKISVIKLADTLIIDEISMCRLDVFNYVCNTIWKYNPLLQIIVVGDFFQLPPILESKGKSFEVWQNIVEYKDRLYPFESHYWKDLNFQTFELTEQIRQTESDYISCLNDIRKGVPNFSCFKQHDKLDINAISICCRNQTAIDMNSQKLNELIENGAESRTYKSKEKGKVDMGNRPTEQQLSLCIGARVVFLVNDTVSYHYCNGEMGTITELNNDTVVIRSDSGNMVILGRYEWKMIEYVEKIDKEGNTCLGTETVGTFEQFPLKLAWAITVHKAQGQTYDKVNIIADRFFENGHMYVALSRCRTKEGMHIVGQLNPWELKCSDKVKAFMTNAKH